MQAFAAVRTGPNRRGATALTLVVAAVTGVMFAMWSAPQVLHAALEVAFWISVAAVLISVAAILRARRFAPEETHPSDRHNRLASICLCLGVAAYLVVAVFLVVRLLQVAIEVGQNYPTRLLEAVPFRASDAWTPALLFAASAIWVPVAGLARVGAILLWTALASVLWYCLSVDALAVNTTAGFERTGLSARVLVGLSAVVACTVAAGGLRRRATGANAAQAQSNTPPEVVHGLSTSCSVVSLMVGFLVVYHLLVPIRVEGNYRWTLGVSGVCAGATSLSCFALARRDWRKGLADAGFGLATLAVASIISLAVPSGAGSLAERYPQLFNAMVVGFAIATGWWTWLAMIWTQQSAAAGDPLAAYRLIPHAKRFAFFSAALALLSGIMMAFWPRLPVIATMDHSYGRIMAGFSGNLFLLLVMLWSARRLRRMTFHLLTAMSVLSTGGFLVIRMLPFASDAG